MFLVSNFILLPGELTLLLFYIHSKDNFVTSMVFHWMILQRPKLSLSVFDEIIFTESCCNCLWLLCQLAPFSDAFQGHSQLFPPLPCCCPSHLLFSLRTVPSPLQIVCVLLHSCSVPTALVPSGQSHCEGGGGAEEEQRFHFLLEQNMPVGLAGVNWKCSLGLWAEIRGGV